MGCYINPATMEKEEFLRKYGSITQGPCEITETHLPVCLVNNGFFTAAAVGWCKSEVEAFSRPDHRPKIWFRVARADLYGVSDLHHFLPSDADVARSINARTRGRADDDFLTDF